MPVADDDGVEFGQVNLALGVLDDGARPRIQAQTRVPFLYVQAARGRQLLGDHEPSSGGPHESYFHVPAPWGGRPRRARGWVGPLNSATSLKGSCVLSPK